jgi:hypothetical protein
LAVDGKLCGEGWYVRTGGKARQRLRLGRAREHDQSEWGRAPSWATDLGGGAGHTWWRRPCLLDGREALGCHV